MIEIELEMRVTGHGHGETEKKTAWYSVTLKGENPAAAHEIQELKLVLKSESETIFTSYPIRRTVSVKLHDPQKKLGEQ